MKNVVLLLDDEDRIRLDLGTRLNRRGYAVHKASSIDEARKIILAGKIDYAIVDLKVDYQSEFGGVEVVNFLKRHQPQSRAIILSAYDLDASIRSRLEVDIDGFVSKGGQTNYITAVIEKLDEFENIAKSKTCFVIMPMSDSKSCRAKDWTEIYERMIKMSVEGAGYNYKCVRSDGLAGNIIEDILDNLNRADLVIADLTDRNPNVFYELGVRHTLRDGTILIAQNLDDIPFDLRPYAVQAYEWRLDEERRVFRKRLQEVIRALEAAPERGTSPVRKYLNR